MNQVLSYHIEICVQYAVKKGLCEKADQYMLRNRLMELFHTTQPYDGTVESVPENIGETLSILCDYAAEQGLLEMNTATYRELLDNCITGAMLMPPSQVQQKFAQKYTQSPKAATDWFYTLCRDCNYIRTNEIARNVIYPYESKYSTFEITINLTKPEKDPREIERQKSLPQTGYPKCPLCLENVGYAGRLGWSPRQVLRTIPLTLAGENWNLQYSPYVYYNEHCIVLSSEHKPMTLNETSFVRMFDFLEQFPHYFIGSNAPLPIVGGSILSHEHYQGGSYTMPMEKARSLFPIKNSEFKNVHGNVLSWPMTALRFSSNNRYTLTKLAMTLMQAWKGYSDPSCDILCRTDEIAHNAVTPIARINSGGEFELDLVLRNNRTSAEHPLGIFHPHADKHHIKKENIGLIEVMGLFILPGRLKPELEEMSKLLCNNSPIPEKLSVHAPWLESLRSKYPMQANEILAMELLKDEVGKVCAGVLQDAGVYKENEAGRAGLLRFLATCGFETV